jgi:hypothetical protein
MGVSSLTDVFSLIPGFHYQGYVMTHLPGYANVQQVLDVLRAIHEQMA